MYGQKLRGLREIEGWTQEQVAKKIGVTKQTYSHYENETRRPGLDTIRKLAAVYQVNIDSIFSEEELKQKDEIISLIPGMSNIKKEAFEKLLSLTDEETKHLLSLIDQSNKNKK